MNTLFSKSAMRLALLLIALLSVSITATNLQVFPINGKEYYLTGSDLEIATWKNGALGVYTTIHDDWGSTSINGVYKHLDTVNTNRGLITSSCAISDMCDEYYVAIGKEFIRHGHDLHSHSVTHTQGMSREEIFKSKADLEAKFGNIVEFYVFPFDAWNDGALQSLKDAGYIGARSGNRYPRIDASNANGTIPNMTNDANFTDPFALQFDVFPRTNSAYKKVPDNGDNTAFLKRYVQDAIDYKGWAIQEFHDLSNSNSLSIPLNEYQSLLDSVASAKNKNQIWSSGPTEVIRYRYTREYAGTPTLSGSANGYELNFSAPANVALLNKYHTSITVFFRAADITGNISAVQNGVVVPSSKIEDGYFSVDADPTLGAVTITGAIKPYMAYPFLDPMDTIPSNIPEFKSYQVYSRGGTEVYYNGAIWKNAYWTQNGEPGVTGPWSKVYNVTDIATNSRTSAGGSISPSGKELVTFGSSKKYTITAEPGYEVDYVLVNGENVGAVYEWEFVGISSASTIEAILSPIVETGPSWTITSSASVGGSISPEGARAVRNGGTQSYTITAVSGNRLDSVIVDGVNEGAIATKSFANVTGNHTIAAYFSAVPTFTITAAVAGPGSIDPVGTVSVVEGESKTFSFTADEASRLDSVIVNGKKVAETTSYSFTAVAADQSITAYFSSVPRYSIEATTTAGGTITPSGVKLVTEGSNITFTANAADGFTFKEMLVDGGSVAQSVYTFTNVVAPHTIKSVFEAVPTCELIVNQSANGTIAPSSKVVNQGSDQPFTITPKNGYYIVDVQVDGVSVGAVSSYTIPNMTKNVTVTATFAIKTYVITATAGANGSISPAAETTVDHGASQSYVITANTDYEIATLVVNGKAQTVVSNYTFTNVTAAQSIEVTFKTVDAGGCADIAPWNANDAWYTYKAGDQRVDSGKIYEVTNKGYTYYQPSSPSGTYGWKFVGSCN